MILRDSVEEEVEDSVVEEEEEEEEKVEVLVSNGSLF